MKSSHVPRLFCVLLPLLLTSCGKKEGYEIRGNKVIWNGWQGDGLYGKWSEFEMAKAVGFKILEKYEDPCPGFAINAQDVFSVPAF